MVTGPKTLDVKKQSRITQRLLSESFTLLRREKNSKKSNLGREVEWSLLALS